MEATLAPTASKANDMTAIRDRSHCHFAAFVDWIRPEPSTRQAIAEQAKDVRARIEAQAEKDGLTVRSMPDSGSFAKQTGLRRHMRGNVEVEGQDVDLPFVLKRTTDDGDRIGELLNRFDHYAQASYPATPRKITKSSVELTFSTGIRHDLVPMLETDKADYQLILKSNGTRRLTSVSRHTEFVERRTSRSTQQPGRVAFNECVRLVKWWRCLRLTESQVLDKVSTMLIELLCASAFDRLGVQETYTDTIHQWFSWIAHVTAKRVAVLFTDYPSIESGTSSHNVNSLWRVDDPVNSTNNVVPAAWGNIELRELTDWFEAGRDAMARVVSLEADGRLAEMERVLGELFGTAMITHGTTP
jgi:Second Messenger Oligonucleotide or Dinucleotide Synthetase domain